MGAATDKKEIKLLDCTLGVGGELISWRYGETVIREMRSLLLNSGLEVIEYGCLCSNVQGPHHSVYSSTELPSGFEKQPGQRYALLLDKNAVPELAWLPDRGERTADIIRVLLTRDRMDRELEYCASLVEKEYELAILIDETGQYDAQQLSGILRKVDALKPCACYIFDTSGVLDEQALEEVFALYEKELSAGVEIGFHGRDNLQIAFTLAKHFCGFETKHGLCLDVSVAGMGVGALHLVSLEFAEWMNETFKTDYDLAVLEFLEVYVEQHVSSKITAGERLLYKAAAKQKCSYLYVEYYCGLPLEPYIQLGVYAEIAKDAAFVFDKSEANKALVHYRKKRLNLVIVILTANRPLAVQNLLKESAEELLRYGVDVVVYDSSDDERTHAVTANFQFENYSNVYYKRHADTKESFDAFLDNKVISAYREHLDYDYIWLIQDNIIPTVSGLYDDLISAIEHQTEYLVVDAAFRNNYRFSNREYSNCLDFFAENSSRLSVLGSSIVKSTMVERVLNDRIENQGNDGFWLPIVPLRIMAAEKATRTGLLITDAFKYNQDLFFESFMNRETFETWGQKWYQAVMSLPTDYNQAKARAVRIQIADVHPFHLKAMLFLRSKGIFDLSVYKRYQQRLSEISDTPKWKFRFVGLMPKHLAKTILRAGVYVTEHQTSRISKMAKRLFNIYVRLGR